MDQSERLFAVNWPITGLETNVEAWTSVNVSALLRVMHSSQMKHVIIDKIKSTQMYFKPWKKNLITLKQTIKIEFDVQLFKNI